MNPKIEDLRKKAFVLYQGLDGVERVNHEVKKMGSAEEKLSEYDLKICLNNIIKNVFVDYVGLEKTKEILSKEVTHVPGYHRTVEEDRKKIHIFERINFMKWFVRLIALVFILMIFGAVYYVMTIDKVESCDNKKHAGSRDMCFLALALSEDNASFCANLSTLKGIHNCYSSVGIKLNDTGVCELIPQDNVETIDIHDKCIGCVAFNLKRLSVCGQLRSPIKQAECESQLERGYSLICESRG